ncbi:SseB family protein [Planctomonas sp. JC2975]|uniref:SseB family protein n=1 Tax=Planctomonas sp. JC2975 TaxID=2729626 RepID=UPI001475457F|nr:SseB family protein [Planctomonas sp. JC2975]NNC13375.1 SseB family protein [Planctomonas sp. JC2975]
MPDADPSTGAVGGGEHRDRHLFGSTDRADSAGLPWEGRHFEQNTATDDDGSADPALLKALTDFADGRADAAQVVEAVRAARLLVPLLAHAGELGETPEGHLVDKTQELSIATVQAPDGRAVLPAFTSVTTMSAWNQKARPVPAVGPRIALAAASEETELVVIDPTSPTEFVLRRPMVRALATGAEWIAPWSDPEVVDAFGAATLGESDVVGLRVSSGDPSARLAGPEAQVGVVLRSGLDADALRALVARLSEAWGASAVIAERVDSLSLRLLSA